MATIRPAAQTPGRRQRSESKQAAILDAAEALFVTDGYELTSVDAIAARATVSKRTVYDHFGDKETLFRSVLERAHEALTATVRAAIEQELRPGRDLRDGLIAFASRVATEAFPSSDYVTYQRLTSRGPSSPRPRGYPEHLLEARFEELTGAGELQLADPARTVRHFTALTLLLVLDALRDDPDHAAAETIPLIISDGVDAFLRAYGR